MTATTIVGETYRVTDNIIDAEVLDERGNTVGSTRLAKGLTVVLDEVEPPDHSVGIWAGFIIVHEPDHPNVSYLCNWDGWPVTGAYEYDPDADEGKVFFSGLLEEII